MPSVLGGSSINKSNHFSETTESIFFLQKGLESFGEDGDLTPVFANQSLSFSQRIIPSFTIPQVIQPLY